MLKHFICIWKQSTKLNAKQNLIKGKKKEETSGEVTDEGD